VVTPASPSLIEVLRSTLNRLEQSEEISSNDPAMAELRGSILRTIAELEVVRIRRPALPQQRILWITPKVRTESEVAPLPAGHDAATGLSRSDFIEPSRTESAQSDSTDAGSRSAAASSIIPE
jgi:hypothetical protein